MLEEHIVSFPTLEHGGKYWRYLLYMGVGLFVLDFLIRVVFENLGHWIYENFSRFTFDIWSSYTSTHSLLLCLHKKCRLNTKNAKLS